MDNILFWLVPVASVLALCFAYYFHKQMMKESEGTPQMIKIAAAVRKGAMSYLKQQYKIVGWVFLGLVILFSIMAYGFHVQNAWVPVAFLTGGFFSGLSGFLGMKTATYASARTANAARNSLNAGLRIAFRSGAVMGLVVVGLGLLDISFWYLLLNAVIPADALTPTHKLCVITTTMLTFGMGASTQALFARVGGGIYTKAADVGADLVGKVEAGIPEDDPRNPATIADNVGDNVGDVAGMGADLYESYCGSILATAALGAAAFIHSADTVMQFKAVIAPMLIAAVGIILSIIGIFAVRTKENATMKDLLGSLAFGTNLSSVLIVAATFLILWLLQLDNWIWISCAVVVGLVVGIIIGRSTEYYTSQSYRPTQKLSESGKTGPATVIISGIGLGMLSTAIPVVAVVIGIIASYLLASAGDFGNVGMGLYGIGIAAVGMLSTLGITLATDAYGPIADNAGGNAEMSGLGAEVRKRTDALDSLGNTTAATGKGFAIGSAALTGLALLASYIEEIRIGLTRLGNVDLTFADGSSISVANATFIDFMDYYEVHLMNPKVLSGMFLGSMMAFLLARAASSAASFNRFSRSAPVKPWVVLAMVFRFTSGPRGLFLACTRRISSRPFTSGYPTTICSARCSLAASAVFWIHTSKSVSLITPAGEASSSERSQHASPVRASPKSTARMIMPAPPVPGLSPVYRSDPSDTTYRHVCTTWTLPEWKAPAANGTHHS